MSSVKVEMDGWASWLHHGTSKVAVVLVHEIFGHDEYIETVAADLAKEGFWAAAIDLYRGKHASTLEEGFKLRSSLTPEDATSAVQAASKILAVRIGKGAKVGSMGFCMGGGFALLGACRLPLAFCVDYYGMIENVDEVRDVTGPIQLYLASEDARITPWAYQQFLPAATKYKKRVDLQLYPNTQHAFHRPNWDGHDPKAAEDAWSRTVRFLSEFK
jgi:carboxymethylenebutenolidase